MKKIIIIGCPGSGKSTFSRALRDRLDIPVYHLDMMYWNADKTTVEKSVFLERLSAVLKKEEWIIDGNYSSTMRSRMAACDTVIFLDYPTALCLDSIRERRGKPRDDMPWVETEDDAGFIDLVKSFEVSQRPNIIELLEQYSYKKIIVFKSREQADDFLDSL